MLENILIWAVTIVGSATLIAHALEPIVRLTKTKRDDAILAKINGFLGMLQSIALKLGLNKKVK